MAIDANINHVNYFKKEKPIVVEPEKVVEEEKPIESNQVKKPLFKRSRGKR